MSLSKYAKRFEEGGDVGDTDEASTETRQETPLSTSTKKANAASNQLNYAVANPQIAQERDSRMRAFYNKQLEDLRTKEASFGEASGIDAVLAQFGAPPGAEEAWMRNRATDLASRGKTRQEAMAGLEGLDAMKAQIATRKTVSDLLSQGKVKEASAIDPTYVKEVQSINNMNMTNNIRDYNMAVSQGYKGSFDQYVKETKAAGASRVSVDASTGKSLAGQIGDIVKDSREKTIAAEKIDQASDRIIHAIDSNKLIAGPLANQRLTMIQIADFMGVKGGDVKVRLEETRSAMQGLAQLTLQGRQEMRGQGAITENESKLAERAISGDITLTPTELKVLANAAKRAADYQRQLHTDLLDTMSQDKETAKLVPYYKVPSRAKPSAVQSSNQDTKSPQVSETPPASALKEGKVTTFANGQQWTLVNGKQQRVR